jgi:hypothetical protein
MKLVLAISIWMATTYFADQYMNDGFFYGHAARILKYYLDRVF